MGARVSIACAVGIASVTGSKRKLKLKSRSVRRLSDAGAGEVEGM
jgi:hypothetical protein